MDCDNIRMKWTPELDSRISDMYKTSTRKEIAAMLGLTEGQVRSRFHTLGLAEKSKPWSDGDLEALRNAYSAETSDKIGLDALAKSIGRCKTNVSRKARELGLTSVSRPKKSGKAPPKNPKYATAEARALATSARIKELFVKHGHPRGALGMKHTEASKEKMRAASKRAWNDPSSKFNSEEFRQSASDRMLENNKAGKMSQGHTRARGGKRSDLGGKYFRSAWEANYARYLNLLVSRGEVLKWEFECKTFVFEAIKRGTRAYTPDFKVSKPDGSYEWHEVKGWMDPPSVTRLKRMAKYYPEERVIVIDQSWFRQANRLLAGSIPNWESGSVR